MVSRHFSQLAAIARYHTSGCSTSWFCADSAHKLCTERGCLQKVAENLGVSVATAYRTEELFDETGDVCKRMYPPGHGNKKLTDVGALFIVELWLKGQLHI